MNTEASQLPELMVHAAWLRRFARALLRDGDEAEDLAQSTLVTAWQHPPAPDSRPRSWLARIAQNRAKDLRRAEARRGARELAAAEVGPAPPPGPEQLLGDLQIHRTVAEVVTALEEPFRETLVLRYYEGLSAAEIASRLRTPAGTIRWRLKEGLERVRRALDQRHGGDRRQWTLALLPLLPPLATRGSQPAPVRLWPVAGMGLLLVASAGLVTVALWPRGRWPVAGAPALVSPAAAPGGAANGRGSGGAARARPLVRLPLVASPAGDGAEGRTEAEAILRQMLGAIAAGSYDDFLLYASDEMKARLGKEAIAELSHDLAPALERGFQLEPLGTLRQQGQEVHLWKLDLGAAEEQHLIRLALEDGRAAGFWVQ